MFGNGPRTAIVQSRKVDRLQVMPRILAAARDTRCVVVHGAVSSNSRKLPNEVELLQRVGPTTLLAGEVISACALLLRFRNPLGERLSSDTLRP